MRPDQTTVTLVTLSPAIVKLGNGNYYEIPMPSTLRFTAGTIVIEREQRAEIERGTRLQPKSDGTLRDGAGAVHATFNPTRKLGALQVKNVRPA